MPRALVHPRLFSRLTMAYTRRVTIEQYGVTGRSPTGAEVRAWSALPGHTEMPAAISALNAVQRASYASADTRIMLAGYHPEITTAQRARSLDDDMLYEIVAVDQLYGQITRLVCRTVSIGAEN